MLSFIKIVSIIAIVLVLANMLLYAFHVINDAVFWIVLVVIALIAYPGLTWMKKHSKKI